MAATLSLKGDRELLAALERLKRGEQNKAFRKSFRIAAKLIRDRAASKAPRRTGRLAKSLKVRAGRKSRQGPSITVISDGTAAKKNATNKRLSKRTRSAFRGETYYGGFIEFGTRRQPAQPFLRPAFDESLPTTEATIRRELIAELDRIWATK